MNISLQVNGVSKVFNQLLFGDVNLTASRGDKIGLIGDNGSGKSTFLKMLSGIENVESGQISWLGDTRVGYLTQEIVDDLDTASGGEKKIIKISQLFYADNNVLLLDEPDNHLDTEHKAWFEQLVADFDGIVIVISHDRHFLKSSINKIWLLEEKQISSYPFGFDKFKDVYQDYMDQREDLWKIQEMERKRLEAMVNEYRDRAASNSKLAKSYHGMVKRYERFVKEMVTKPPPEKEIKLSSNLQKASSKKSAIFIKGLSKSFGKNKVIKDLDLHLACGEKVSINAPNGTGKSTLIT